MFATPFVPDTTPADMHGVAALLALIGNPEAKAALDLLAKLSGEKDAALEAAQKSAADRAAAETALTEAKKLHADMRRRLSDLTDTANARQAAQDARETALAAREAKVGGLAQQIEQTGAAHLDRVASDTNALSAREKRISDREAELDVRERKLSIAEADYGSRISKLKALAG